MNQTDLAAKERTEKGKIIAGKIMREFWTKVIGDVAALGAASYDEDSERSLRRGRKACLLLYQAD